MPLTPVGLTGTLVPAMAGTGQIGAGMPKLALGIATGTVLFAGSATVVTIDTGTLGIGAGVTPLIVPPPLLLASLLLGMQSQQILGPMAPLLAAGIAAGLSAGFAQAILVTTHAGVGAGAGVARIVGAGSAVPLMIQGFESVDLKGQGTVKKATAIGMALDHVFKDFAIPVAIMGAPTPVGGTGVGVGKIV